MRRRWYGEEEERLQDGRALLDVMIYGKRGRPRRLRAVREADSDVIWPGWLAESGHSGRKWRPMRPQQIITTLVGCVTSLQGDQRPTLHVYVVSAAAFRFIITPLEWLDPLDHDSTMSGFTMKPGPQGRQFCRHTVQ